MRGARRIYVVLALAPLVAQTTGTVQVDLSALYSVLPLLISIIMVVMVLGVILGLFRSLGEMVRGALRYTKLKYPALLALPLLAAQTSSSTVQIDLSLLYSVLPLVISLMVVIIVIGMITGVLGSLTDVVRNAFSRQVQVRARGARFFRLALLAPLVAQTQIPGEQLYGSAINVLNVVLPVMIAVIFLVVLLLLPVKVVRDVFYRIWE